MSRNTVGLGRMLVAVAMTVVACGGGAGGDSTSPPPSDSPSLALTLSSSSVTLAQGDTGSVTVTIARHGAVQGTIELSVDGAPSGAVVTLSPASVPEGATTSKVTIVAALAATLQTTQLNVSARTSAGITARQTLSLTVGAARKNVVVKFCASDYPIWVAMQAKGGDWTRVLPDPDRAFRFALGSSGALAVVWPDPSTFVFYGTADEINAAYGACDLDSTVPLKVVRGTVAGVPPGDAAYVALGPAEGVPAVGDSVFFVPNVPDGPRDLLAAHGSNGSVFSMSEFILRRGVNVAANGVVPRLDFRSSEMFLPVSASISITGFEFPSLSVDLVTSSGIDEPLYYNPGAGAQQAVVGLPSSRLIPGDLHQVDVVDGSGEDGSTAALRFVNVFTTAMTNRTIALGPQIGQPAVSILADTPYQRWRVFLAVQPEYGQLAEVDFDDVSGRSVSIVVTRGFSGSDVSWELTIPEFKNVGYSPTWGFQAGTVPEWFVTAVGGDATIFQAPSDGTVVRGSARYLLSALTSRAPRATTSGRSTGSDFGQLRLLRQAKRIGPSMREFRRQR